MTGLSFSLAIIGFVVLSVGIAYVVSQVIRRGNEIEDEQRRRAEAWAALDLPDAQPPWCLRELDPNFVDWQERQWL